MTLYMKIFQNYFLLQKMNFFLTSFLNKKYVKNQKSKTYLQNSDRGRDADRFYNNHFRLFIWEFSEAIFLWHYFLNKIRQKFKIKDLIAKLQTLAKTNMPFLTTIFNSLYDNSINYFSIANIILMTSLKKSNVKN